MDMPADSGLPEGTGLPGGTDRSPGAGLGTRNWPVGEDSPGRGRRMAVGVHHRLAATFLEEQSR